MDPAAVRALLDQLRDSPAWHDVLADGDSSLRRHDPTMDQQHPGTSVASLLSQLQPPVPQPEVPQIAEHIYIAPTQSRHPLPGLSKQELRSCSFQQALPILATLSGNPDFVSAVSDMKKEQADLERQLSNERKSIGIKHESKVKVAVTKANLTGLEGLSQYEADVMTSAFKKEISKFDRDRVLPAWDGLMSKHQAALEALGCPTMYVTSVSADLQRQQRVIQVLEGIM